MLSTFEKRDGGAQVLVLDQKYAAGTGMEADDPKLSWPAVDFTDLEPLYTEYDEDEYDTRDVQGDESDAEEGRSNRRQLEEVPVKKDWSRTCFWIISSSTAVFSSKELMGHYGYHYPLTIAFRAFVVASIAYLVALHLGTDSSNASSGKLSRWGICRPRKEELLPNWRWIPMIPAAVVASSALPMFMEGILHMPSLPVLVMLFPLAYVIESLLLFITCSLIRSGRRLPWETIVALIALSTILLGEYRLTVHGLIWGTCSIIAIGVARGFLTIANEITGPEHATEARIKAYHGFVSMTLILGVVSSGLLAHFKDRKPDPTVRREPLSSSTIVLILINIASLVGTIFSGTSILAYSPISFKEASLSFSNMPVAIPGLLASTTSSLLVFLAALCSSPTVVVSWLQIAAYVLTVACLSGSKVLHLSTSKLVELVQNRINATGILGSRMGSRETGKPSKLFTSVVLLFVAFVTTFVLYDIASFPISELAATEPSVDLSYVPRTRFEVVISMYDESPTAVASLITSILSTTLISSLKRSSVKTIIYTKSPSADLDLLKNQTGAGTILRLPNVGREGGTYLHHIVNNWDSLAEQTMFIQAGAHNKRELLPRINNYLVGETGMLSLGESGVVTNCNSANDRFGWQDSWSIIPSLYSKIYNSTCEPDTQILLSYKGQFIASARRIRGISWDIYRELMQTIESEDGWSHDKTVIGQKGDTSDNPFFGYTVERVWGLLLQCAGEDVAAICPSLLSGTLGGRRGGGVEDCGCVDWIG